MFGVCKGLCFCMLSFLKALPQVSVPCNHISVPSNGFSLTQPLLMSSSLGEQSGLSQSQPGPWPACGSQVCGCLCCPEHCSMTTTAKAHSPGLVPHQASNSKMAGAPCRAHNVSLWWWFLAELHISLACGTSEYKLGDTTHSESEFGEQGLGRLASCILLLCCAHGLAH